MKTKQAQTSCGFIRLGHVAIRAHGFTVVQARPKSMVSPEITSALGKSDRLIGAQEFADLTGCKIMKGTEEIKAKRPSKFKKKQYDILNLI